ncbi:glycosyltransferase [Thermodesulfobacteriota bacterium]
MNIASQNNLSIDQSTIDLNFVSVVVPAYNSPKRTAKCIEALLNQSYPKNLYEIIVIDNGSKDDTAKMIQRYPVIFFAENGIKSPYAARNMGIKKAKGKIIAMVDVNCIPVKNWIHQGVETIIKENADLVGGNIIFTFSPQKTNSEIFDSITNVQIKHNIRERKITKGGNLFVKRSVLDKIGLFPVLRSGGDVIWTGKATSAGFKLAYSSSACATYPARKLGSLLKKQIRVGIGQPTIWLEEGIILRRIIIKTIGGFYPPGLNWLKKLVQERYAGKGKPNITSLWMVAYLCNMATSVGRLIFLFQKYILKS